MDGIIDTVSAQHPLLPLIGLLKTNGKLVMVGAPEKPLELPVFPLLLGMHVTPRSWLYHYNFLCRRLTEFIFVLNRKEEGSW
jgi:D-arabinose 1-dehydrogenase-like Zn-dependent alcohol dehydrogenase